MLSRLIKISEEFNVAVYMTNQGILTCILSFMEVKDNNPHSFGSVVIKSSFVQLLDFCFHRSDTYDLLLSENYVGVLLTQLSCYSVNLLVAVIADPGGGVFISDPKKPAGGHVLAHAATIRLMFRKGKGEQRVCKVFDAPNLPEAEAISLNLDTIGLALPIDFGFN